MNSAMFVQECPSLPQHVPPEAPDDVLQCIVDLRQPTRATLAEVRATEGQVLSINSSIFLSTDLFTCRALHLCKIPYD